MIGNTIRFTGSIAPAARAEQREQQQDHRAGHGEDRRASRRCSRTRSQISSALPSATATRNHTISRRMVACELALHQRTAGHRDVDVRRRCDLARQAMPRSSPARRRRAAGTDVSSASPSASRRSWRSNSSSSPGSGRSVGSTGAGTSRSARERVGERSTLKPAAARRCVEQVRGALRAAAPPRCAGAPPGSRSDGSSGRRAQHDLDEPLAPVAARARR